MHKAKSFFYVSLGILALAVAFHLGATSAKGQAGAGPQVAGVTGSGVVSAAIVDAAGYIWATAGLNNPVFGPIAPPSSTRIIAIGAGEYGAHIFIVNEGGEFWEWTGSSWLLQHSFPSGPPTAAERTTWGRIKAERR
jgi:hypothetical protein